MRHWGLSATGVFLLVSLIPAQPGSGPDPSQVRIRKDLEFLTSDACEGRGITTKGINVAADYIAAEFRKIGLRPGGPDGTYFQPFTVIRGFKTLPRAMSVAELQLNGPQGQTIYLRHGSDFSLNPRGGPSSATGSVVFVGHGITSLTPNHDDYGGVDVKGKIVVLLTRAPRADNPLADPLPRSRDSEADPRSTAVKVANARKHGAVAVLLVNDRLNATNGDALTPPQYGPFMGDLFDIPVVQVKRELADRMLFASTRSTLTQLERDLDADLKPRSTPLTGWAAKVKVNRTPNLVAVKNVVGYLEGAGPNAKEAVVVGAHYDHMGLEGNRRLFAGTSPPGGLGGVGFPLVEASRAGVYRGADDNASGTSAVIELARRFTTMPNRTGRRVVFIAFSAEESGLLGSRHYTRSPLFPLKDTAAMVNLDMVGRMQDSRLLGMGLGTGRGLEPLVDRLAKKHQIKLEKALTGRGPTDHMPFCEKGVPGIAFFSGFHEYYHLPSDRPETINVPGLRRVVDLTADVLNELASSPTRPEFSESMDPFNRATTLWAAAPCVGAELDFSDKGPGVRIRQVVRDTPAARAGLKSGDRIETLAGKPLTGGLAYLDTVRELRPGAKVEFKGTRDGKPLSVTVELATVPFLAKLKIEPDFTDLMGGLLLAVVEKGGQAEKAGLQVGDRLTEINGKPIPTPIALFGLTAGIRKGMKVEFTYVRKGETKKVTLTAE